MSTKTQRRSALRRLFRQVEHLEARHLLTSFFVDFSVLEPTDYTQSEVVVRFSDEVDVPSLTQMSLVEQEGVDSAYLSGPLGEGFRSDEQLFEIPVLPGQSVEELVEYYNGLDFIDFAEPNYRMESAAIPNDQFYNVLWGMENINAPSAWDTRTDSSSIVVGVIDSGVEYTHPDLVDNIWTNSGEIAGNGIDDDGNGFVDDFYGWDFENDDNDPTDTNGHGTHVAGTIGAKGNNGTGVTGVGWDASLMSLKVIGTGTNADVARAIDYATDNGAKITNNSYGYAGTNVGGSQVISNAIGRAKNAGVLYIVAAGNSRDTIPASDMDGNFNSWPAEYSKVHDNVITVAAIDEGGAFANYSHWGDQSVQIAAPGTQIGSTYTQGRYVYNSGTSMAA
ncbi:MAG: S8 family peptidase, partial [Planctomycetota bacterium]